MARHRTRKEMISAKKQFGSFDNTSPRRWNKIVFGTIFGISTCAIIMLYFAFSTPNLDRVVEKEVTGEWHDQKHIWSLQPLNDHQHELVCNRVKIERLNLEYLRNILIVRTPGSENIIKVKQFLMTTMKSLGWTVEENKFKDSPPKSFSKKKIEFANVIATYNPRARRRLVLACHYDSKVTPTGFLGATDSAVPCAMMIEIAKVLAEYLARTPKDMDLTLQYLFLDGEEAFEEWTDKDSLYGSRHLAAKWDKQKWPPGPKGNKKVLDSIDLFVLLDLLGEKDPSFVSMRNTHSRHYKELIRIEEKLHVKDGLRYFKPQIKSWSVQDDHVPFLNKNVPVLHIIPSPFPKQWHRIGDNGENLHNDTIARLTKIFGVFVAEYLHLEPIAF
uniref:glutaminyl-peptide cyclotransferase-like n=1 Tax=Styela clava TaxID=7725 RepID=UPI00193A077B|nr:glutaminyl-peptide cyclotransferase-like [Styela clava]